MRRLRTLRICAALAALGTACGPEPASGPVAGGLQLTLTAPGKNTRVVTEADAMLHLLIAMQNVSDSSAPLAPDQGTYGFEYEIDGTWYAFDSAPAVRTPGSVMMGDPGFVAVRSLAQTVAPAKRKEWIVAVPLAGRSPSLQLHAVTSGGAGARFVPRPGEHVVRVRTGRALEATRPPVVSNRTTMSFRTSPRIDTSRQSLTFSASRGTPLGVLRFANAPVDGQAFVRQVVARPPDPASAPQLITAAALQVVEPLPYYDLLLPRRLNAPDPSLPTTHRLYHYIVRNGDHAVATIRLGVGVAWSVKASDSTGLLLEGVGGAASSKAVFLALQRLAALDQVRGGDYEPRLLRIVGVRGTQDLRVLWLHSSSRRPDLFYWPPDPDYSGKTKVEREKLYTVKELLAAARALPVAPRHDGAWAIARAVACERASPGSYGDFLMPKKAEVEIGLSDQQDRVVWYVFIPAREPDPRIARQSPPPGAAFLVDEADGSCEPVMLQ